MIKFLAQLFRGLHYIVGVSEPPPGTSDRKFVFAWLGGIALLAAFFVSLVFYPWQQQQYRIIDKASHGVATWRKGLSSDDVSLILVYVR